MGVALPLPGRGGGISPHMKAFVGYFLKSSPQSLCPKGHRVGCNIPCCRGRGASSPTNQSPHIQKPLRQFSKHFKQFFSVFYTCFMPARASFGIKRSAFTRGHGGGVSPNIQRPSTNVRKSCAERTMGVALPLPGCGGGISPHMKALLRYFLKSSPQSLCPKGHRVGCNIPCCRGRGASSPTKQTHGISTPQGVIGD